MAKNDFKYFNEDEKKEAVRKSQTKYKAFNREEINKKARDKIYCKVCNCEIARSSKARHEKLNKHIKNIKK